MNNVVIFANKDSAESPEQYQSITWRRQRVEETIATLQAVVPGLVEGLGVKLPLAAAFAVSLDDKNLHELKAYLDAHPNVASMTIDPEKPVMKSPESLT